MSIASFFRSNARVKRDTIRPEAMARGNVYRDMSDERLAQASEMVMQITADVKEDHRRAKERMGIPDASAELDEKPTCVRCQKSVGLIYECHRCGRDGFCDECQGIHEERECSGGSDLAYLPARIVEALPDAIAEEELADRLLVIEPRPAEQMEG